MGRVTDNERREVAERLRSFVTDDSVYADVDACRVLHSIGLYYKDIDRIYFSGFDVARLADLIEPGDMSQGRRDIVACDREALLALADEMQRELDECASDHEIVGNIQSQIDRIREACNVVDAG